MFIIVTKNDQIINFDRVKKIRTRKYDEIYQLFAEPIDEGVIIPLYESKNEDDVLEEFNNVINSICAKNVVGYDFYSNQPLLEYIHDVKGE